MKEIISIILFVAVVIGDVIGIQFLASKVFQDKYPQAIFGELVRLSTIILIYWFFNKYFMGIEFSKTKLIVDLQESKWMAKGLLMGTALIFSTYAISFFSKAIKVHVSIEATNDFLIYIAFFC